jgi:hypothetical protein
MKNLSSKRAKSTQISTRTKKTVYERDNGLCVVCGRRGVPDAHYIPRSKGGLGIEQNIVTLCRECHDRFDHGDSYDMGVIGTMVRMHLMDMYPDWEYPQDRYHPAEDSKLIYQKYGGEL